MKNKLFIAVAVALTALSASNVAHADIASKMNSMYDSMTNVTKSGSYRTAQRGVITGGGLQVRNKIVDFNPINIQLPRLNAGCGGIDAFVGSFSFINTDQIIALFRSIASNAKGFAFQLALKAASELIGNEIEALQKLIQSINNLNMNSCELSSGLVNLAWDTMSGSSISEAWKNSSLSNGIGEDISQIRQNFSDFPNTSVETYNKLKNKSSAPEAQLVGNLVINAFEKDPPTKYMSGADDKEFEYGLIMAITGSVYISEPKEGDQNGSDDKIDITPWPDLLTLQTFIDGCDGEKTSPCTAENVRYKNKNNWSEAETTKLGKFDGLKTIILKALVGKNNDGIIHKFRNDGLQLTESEKNVVGLLGNNMGAIVRNLSVYNEEIAVAHAEKIASVAALYQSHKLLNDYFKLVDAYVSKSAKSGAEKQEFLKTLKARQAQLTQDYIKLTKDYGSASELYKEYITMQQVTTKMALLPGELGERLAKNLTRTN